MLRRSPATNIIFAKAGVWCSYESLVQGSNSVFQMNIYAKKSPPSAIPETLASISKQKPV
jgi:hypothetical protein